MSASEGEHMTPVGHRLRRESPRSERGSILIELIVVCSLLVVVLGAVFAVMSTTASNAPREHERAQSIREAQATLDRMTRELRQAYVVNSTSYVRMDFNIRKATGNRRVAYDCSVPAATAGQRSCRRYEAAVGAALPAEGVLVVDRLLNGTNDEAGRVFFADDPLRPKFVRARIVVPAKGTEEKGTGTRSCSTTASTCAT